MRMIRAVPLIFLLAIGCTITKEESIKTGLCKDDPDELLLKFNQIKNNETTRIGLAALGFKDLGKTKNVRVFVGAPAFTEIYGSEVFSRMDPVKLTSMEFLTELNRFTLFKIPYRYIVIEEDRFYFTTKETIRKGDDLSLSLVLRDDVVIYHAPKHVKIDEKTTDSAFMQGFFEIIDKYGKFGSNIKSLVENLKDFMKKNKDDE